MKIAILGGSFDPVHNGHLALAENVRLELHYDKIIFFPAFISPFKQNKYGQNEYELFAEQRRTMLLLATENNPYFAVDDFELRQKNISYTIDTVAYCYKTYPIDGKLGLIIGADLLNGFYAWKAADSLLASCELIVGMRPSKVVVQNGLKVEIYDKNALAASDTATKRSAAKTTKPRIPPYTRLNNETLQISSTYIRTAIQQKKAWRYLVPDCIYRYIVQNELYR